MGERDAGPATTKITKTTHGDYDADGHAWIGRRVRFFDEDEGGDPVDGTVISRGGRRRRRRQRRRRRRRRR